MSTLSPAAVASNRANARKSTGPRTPRGKAIAATNALRHGMFARDLLLTGESADELLTLKTGMIQRLDPRDPLELEIVERVVASLWKIRRLQRFERLAYQQQAEAFDDREGYEHREAHGLGHRQPIPAEVAWQTGGEAFQQRLDRIENHQHRLENALHRSLRQLDKLRKQEADVAPGWFAEQALVAERGQHETWRNEAADAESAIGAAKLSDARRKRERLRIDREEEATMGSFDAEPELTSKRQLQAYLYPDQNRQNEAEQADDSAAKPAGEEQVLFYPVCGEEGERQASLNGEGRVTKDAPSNLAATIALDFPSPQPSPRVQGEGGSNGCF